MSEQGRNMLLLAGEIWLLVKKYWKDGGEEGILIDNEIILSLGLAIQNFGIYLYKMQYEGKSIEEIEKESSRKWGHFLQLI